MEMEVSEEQFSVSPNNQIAGSMIKAAPYRSLAKKLGLLAEKEQAALALRVMKSFPRAVNLESFLH